MTKNQEILGWMGIIYMLFGVGFLLLGLVFGFGGIAAGEEVAFSVSLGSSLLLIIEGWLMRKAAIDSSKTTILYILAGVGLVLQIIGLISRGFSQFFNGVSGIITLLDFVFDILLFVLVYKVRQGR